MAVNAQGTVCNLRTRRKMMCTTCKNWTHSKCCYLTNENFVMYLLCNHRNFPFTCISDTELLDLLLSTKIITPTTFNETYFSVVEPHIHNNYPLAFENNAANDMSLEKLHYFNFNVRSFAKSKHKVYTSLQCVMSMVAYPVRKFGGTSPQTSVVPH